MIKKNLRLNSSRYCSVRITKANAITHRMVGGRGGRNVSGVFATSWRGPAGPHVWFWGPWCSTWYSSYFLNWDTAFCLPCSPRTWQRQALPVERLAACLHTITLTGSLEGVGGRQVTPMNASCPTQRKHHSYRGSLLCHSTCFKS